MVTETVMILSSDDEEDPIGGPVNRVPPLSTEAEEGDFFSSNMVTSSRVPMRRHMLDEVSSL